ncbi:hypothetical protein Daus18300_000180 [Diaporthe australafricana]|uniref:DUF7908 domain-containing protein n=1 Tax=Diaporthe australafricana TaxID=127596 RepID=A0ABR3Y6Z3_9PEZI
MTANVLIALFSALAGPALVSGNHLAAVKHDLLAMANPEPASWCFTYYSCYLAAQETPQLPYPLPGGVVTTITSIVSVPTLVPIFPTPLLTTSLSGLPSSPSPTTPGPLPTVLPGPVDIIIAIIPRVTGPFLEKRTLAKRDIGGFISDVGSPNPKDCTSATTFRLDSGQLGVTARPGFSIYADVGVSFNEFRSREVVNAGAGVVTTTFAQGFDSILSFSNASFAGGEAGFCQVAATGQVPSSRFNLDHKRRNIFELAFLIRGAANHSGSRIIWELLCHKRSSFGFVYFPVKLSRIYHWSHRIYVFGALSLFVVGARPRTRALLAFVIVDIEHRLHRVYRLHPVYFLIVYRLY